jgi:hypothetical protein
VTFDDLERCSATRYRQYVERQDAATVYHVRRLLRIWSKFQEFDRRPIIQDERDPHPG